MDAVYNRPFLQYGKTPVALGGYVEANTQYAVTDGVTEGFSFQMRRMTLFVASTIRKKIKLILQFLEMNYLLKTKRIEKKSLINIKKKSQPRKFPFGM